MVELLCAPNLMPFMLSLSLPKGFDRAHTEKGNKESMLPPTPVFDCWRLLLLSIQWLFAPLLTVEWLSLLE
jgi:hypothetical protein